MLWDLREVPMIFSAVLTTLFFSEALGLPNQMEIQLVSTLSTVPRQKVVRLGGGRCAIFTQCSKCRYCWAHLTSIDALIHQSSLLVICTLRGLMLLTTSTAQLEVVSDEWGMTWRFLSEDNDHWSSWCSESYCWHCTTPPITSPPLYRTGCCCP